MTHLLLASLLPLFDKIQVVKNYHLLHVTSLVHYIYIIALVRVLEIRKQIFLLFFFYYSHILAFIFTYQISFSLKKLFISYFIFTENCSKKLSIC